MGRPLIDDDYINKYLHNRYKDLGPTAALDLIVGVLDCLANAISRPELPSTISLYRHFLINKVPLLLLRLNLPILSSQYVISQALLKSDSTVLSLDPSMGSASADMILDLPNDVKQEFLFACALHGIIEETAIEGILGEVPLQTMARRRYTQEELVSECIVDPERAERLVGEIDDMEGNSGAVVLALVEVSRT